MPCVDWPQYNFYDCALYLQKQVTITLHDPCADYHLNLTAVNVDEGPCVTTPGQVQSQVQPAIQQDDFTPYFPNWDQDKADEVIELEIGVPYLYEIPEPYDCCGSNIEITVDLQDISQFTHWKRASESIRFKADEKTKTGFYRVRIGLNNKGRDKTNEYFLNVYIAPLSLDQDVQIPIDKIISPITVEDQETVEEIAAVS